MRWIADQSGLSTVVGREWLGIITRWLQRYTIVILNTPPPPPTKAITHCTLIIKERVEMSLYLIKQHAIKKYVGVR